MKKHKYVILGSIIIVIVILFLSVRYVYRGVWETRVIHEYPLSGNKVLVVDNWDCGALCDFMTKVYVQETRPNGRLVITKQPLFCEGVTDITLTEVTDSTAIIASMERTNDECEYNVGDTLNF